jgi:hypothetical protein
MRVLGGKVKDNFATPGGAVFECVENKRNLAQGRGERREETIIFPFSLRPARLALPRYIRASFAPSPSFLIAPSG